jgi:hypothetical protein
MSAIPPSTQEETSLGTAKHRARLGSFADTLEAMHIIRYRPLTRDPSRGGYVLTKTVIAVILAVTLWVPRWVGSPTCRAARAVNIGSLISRQIFFTQSFNADRLINISYNGLCPEPFNWDTVPIYSANPLSPTKWLTWWFGTW